MKNIARLWLDERGATLAEYSLLVGLIATVCVAVVLTFGTKLVAMYTNIVATY